MILLLLSTMKSFNNSYAVLLSFMWKDMGFTPGRIGMYLFSFILCGSFASLFSEKFERKLGAKNVFYISMMSMFPLMSLFMFLTPRSAILSYLVFITIGFVTMLAMPVMMVMAQRIMPEYKSIMGGFINGFSWGISAIFLTIIGFAAQKFGIPKVIIITSLLPVLCSYFIKFLPELESL